MSYVQESLFGELPIPEGMRKLAIDYGRTSAGRWRFLGMTRRRDLLGEMAWLALFIDKSGVKHSLTIDDLRSQTTP